MPPIGPDVFISYSSSDENFARLVHSELKNHGLDAFLAAVSILPGERWSQVIRENLKEASWIIVLASRTACASPRVQQELASALDGSKTLIPVVWDMRPNDLPGWLGDYQALDLRNANLVTIREAVGEIAGRVKSKRRQEGMFVAAAIVGAFLLLSGGK